ncbi:hypothetical protein HDU67_001403 [Dinochytrium kinnereticum]|nr:hypothetical protein HDU67_001403 [Dinochytrium kinnereticum]
MSIILKHIKSVVFAQPPNFSVDRIPDLKGKVAIVTGASSGLGLISTLEMAKRGAHVILACRSVKKAQDAVDKLKADNPAVSLNLTVMELELSSLASVWKFATEFKKMRLPLHILMNNAGVMAIHKFTLSTDGIEMQLAANHFGHFYLTTLLSPIMEETSKSSETSCRIVNLSSLGHTLAKPMGIDFEGCNLEANYVPWAGYGQSKLANILLSKELHRRFAERGLGNIKANAVHPGGVRTNLAIQSESQYTPSWLINLIWYGMATPEFGSLTQLYAATSPEIDEKGIGGEYLVPTAIVGESSALANDADLAKKLWTWSEKVIEEKGFSLTL